MADPALIAVPADAWLKVATNVLTGQIHIKKTTPSNYFSTYRDTGGAAPTLQDEGILMPWGKTAQIESSGGIDVYIFCAGAAGRVRVDL